MITDLYVHKTALSIPQAVQDLDLAARHSTKYRRLLALVADCEERYASVLRNAQLAFQQEEDCRDIVEAQVERLKRRRVS